MTGADGPSTTRRALRARHHGQPDHGRPAARAPRIRGSPGLDRRGVHRPRNLRVEGKPAGPRPPHAAMHGAAASTSSWSGASTALDGSLRHIVTALDELHARRSGVRLPGRRHRPEHAGRQAAAPHTRGLGGVRTRTHQGTHPRRPESRSSTGKTPRTAKTPPGQDRRSWRLCASRSADLGRQ